MGTAAESRQMTRPAALVAAAQRRREDAERRVHEALRKADRRHMPVSFRAIAELAGVSTDFLYRHPSFREDIERRRARASPRPRPQEEGPRSNIIRILTEQLRAERTARVEEVARLRNALAAAHEELLDLRRSAFRSSEPQ